MTKLGVGLFLMLAAMSANATFIPSPIHVDSQGREWLDPEITAWRSWSDFTETCDSLTGYCSGVLAPYRESGWGSLTPDLSGYMWASTDDVRFMFGELGGGVLDVYTPMLEDTFFAAFGGWTRDTNGTTGGVAYFTETIIDGVQTQYGAGYTFGSSNDYHEPSWGGWFYKPPVGVPTPGVLELGATSLLLMLVFTRRRRGALSIYRARPGN